MFERWLIDKKYRTPQMANGWTEEIVRQMDELALADGTNPATRSAKERYEQNRVVAL